MKKLLWLSLLSALVFAWIVFADDRGGAQPISNLTGATEATSGMNEATSETTGATEAVQFGTGAEDNAASGAEGQTEGVDPASSETDHTSQTSEEENLPAHLMLLRYGIITGDGSGNLLPDKHFNRAEMTVVLIRMLGEEEEAKGYSSDTGFADHVAIPKWARPYAAYARSTGLMRGDEFGIYDAMGKVSGEQLAVMLRRILGYQEQVKWKENIGALEAETGIVVPDKSLLFRSEVFEVLWDVFSNNIKNGGGSLIDKFSHIDEPVR